MRKMGQTLRSTFKKALRLENRRRAIRKGDVETIPTFVSQILGNSRSISVYLPPGYGDRNNTRRYPVLYMQDGQNLFDPERSFVRGQHWRLREAADEVISGRTAAPMIIIGIDNAGVQRIDEYTHAHVEGRGGGKASDYARFLFEELKPVIDGTFRTDASHSSVGGSSLGGLLSLVLALHHPEAFSGAAVMSPSVWWNGRSILHEVERFPSDARRPRLWVDIGGREGREALEDARRLRDLLFARGWNDENFRFHEDRRADHSEGAWAGRVKKVLEFLYPPV